MADDDAKPAAAAAAAAADDDSDVEMSGECELTPWGLGGESLPTRWVSVSYNAFICLHLPVNVLPTYWRF